MRRKDRILVASNFQFSQKMEILSTLNTLTPNNEEQRSNSDRLELSIFQKIETLNTLNISLIRRREDRILVASNFQFSQNSWQK